MRLEKYVKNPIFVILVLSLAIPLFWIKPGYVISHSDYVFPMEYSPEVFTRYLYAWTSKNSLGSEYSRGIMQIPYQFSIYSLWLLRIPLEIIQYLHFSFLIFLGALFFYKIVTRFMGGSAVYGILMAFLYVFNPYSLTVFWSNISLTLLPYLLAPGFFYYTLLTIGVAEGRKKNYFLLGLFSWGISWCSNPVFFATVSTMSFLFSMFYYRLENHVLNTRSALKRIGCYFLAVVIPNLYWIPVFVSGLVAEASAVASNNIGFEGNVLSLVQAITKKSSILELLKLKGFWVLYSKYQSQYYYDYANFYKQADAVFFVPVAIILAYFYNSRFKLDRFATLLLIFTALFLIVLSGTHTLIGGIFYSLILKTPVGVGFRNPLDKFGPLFAIIYLLLVYFSYLKIKAGLKSRSHLVVLNTVLLVYVFVVGYPVYSGTLFRKSFDSKLSSYYTKIPKEYKVISGHLEQKGRLYVLPYLEQYIGTFYKWEESNYQGGHFSYFLFKPDTPGGQAKLPVSMMEWVVINPESAVRLANLLGVTDYIYHHDIFLQYHRDVFKYSRSAVSKAIERYLATTAQKEYEGVNADVYTNSSKPFPEVGVATNVVGILTRREDYESMFSLPFIRRVLDSGGGFVTSREYSGVSTYDSKIFEGLSLYTEYPVPEVWNNGWATPVITKEPFTPSWYLMTAKERVELFNASGYSEKIDLLNWNSAKRAEESIIFPEHKSALIKEYEKISTELLNILDEVKVQDRGASYYEVVDKVISYSRRYSEHLDGKPDITLYKLLSIARYDDTSGCLGPQCYGFGKLGPMVSVPVSVLDSENDYDGDGFKLNNDKYSSFSNIEDGVAIFSDYKTVENEAAVITLDTPPRTKLTQSSEWQEVKSDFWDREGTGRNVYLLSIEDWTPGNDYNIFINVGLKINPSDTIGVVEEIDDYKEEGSHSLHLLFKHVVKKEDVFFKDAGLPSSSLISGVYPASNRSVKAWIYYIGQGKPDTEVVDTAVIKKIEPNLFLVQESNTLQKVPSIQYTKLSPVHYSVSIDKSDSRAFLYLNQNFNKMWKVYRSESRLDGLHVFRSMFMNPLKTSHRVFNGYSNVWEIDSSLLANDTNTFHIFFLPQLYFVSGVAFTAIMLLLFVLKEAWNVYTRRHR